MAIVIGTNAGFVTTAPTSDPSGAEVRVADNRANALKDTSPNGNFKVTEIGWWCDNATQEANFEVGIYDDLSNRPENLLSGESRTNAKGTGSGWKVATGLNIALNPETIYWIGFQLDNTATTTNIDSTGTGAGLTGVDDTANTTLPDPWTSGAATSRVLAIYALVEVSTGTNLQLNISDVWKQVPAVQINIGDAWKPVVGMQLNIGDTWKSIF